jgi:hypothetical protein
MKISFVLKTLLIGGFLTFLGLYMFKGALHSGFYPVFLLIPNIYFAVVNKMSFESPQFFIPFAMAQFIYYAIILYLWQKLKTRK